MEVLHAHYINHMDNNQFQNSSAFMVSILEEPSLYEDYLQKPTPQVTQMGQSSKKGQSPKKQVSPSKQTDFKEITEAEPIPQSQTISRLYQELDKHNLVLKTVAGQVFLMIFQAVLQGNKKDEEGLLMMTNYRILFFKERKKIVDLPFGLVLSVEYESKKVHRIQLKLKYPLSWRFAIPSLKYFTLFQLFIPKYYKYQTASSSFAFAFAQSIEGFKEQHACSIIQYYDRIGLTPRSMHKPDAIKINPSIFLDSTITGFSELDNSLFQLCPAYPSLIYSHPTSKNTVQYWNALGRNRRNGRFPIVGWLYKSIPTKEEIPIWIAASYQSTIDKDIQVECLKRLRPSKQKLLVLAYGAKPKQPVDESAFDSLAQVTYLSLPPLNALLQSYQSLVKSVLSPCPSSASLLTCPYLNHLSSLLFAVSTLTTHILNLKYVLLRDDNGYDGVLVLLSLAMIVLQPRYRTVKGLEELIMSVWIEFGHPFKMRLGEKINAEAEMAPVFLMFLDAVTQLMHANPLHFEYNNKYLSHMVNLMMTNIYGTFIANSPKEHHLSQIQSHTVSIFSVLSSPIALSSFYEAKHGMLTIPSTVKLWKEHFTGIAVKPKDTYSMIEGAQDNSDYINLQTRRIKQENERIKRQIHKQAIEIDELRKQIQKRDMQK